MKNNFKFGGPMPPADNMITAFNNNDGATLGHYFDKDSLKDKKILNKNYFK